MESIVNQAWLLGLPLALVSGVMTTAAVVEMIEECVRVGPANQEAETGRKFTKRQMPC